MVPRPIQGAPRRPCRVAADRPARPPCSAPLFGRSGKHPAIVRAMPRVGLGSGNDAENPHCRPPPGPGDHRGTGEVVPPRRKRVGRGRRGGRRPGRGAQGVAPPIELGVQPLWSTPPMRQRGPVRSPAKVAQRNSIRSSQKSAESPFAAQLGPGVTFSHLPVFPGPTTHSKPRTVPSSHP